jgi:hypothetical protein
MPDVVTDTLSHAFRGVPGLGVAFLLCGMGGRFYFALTPMCSFIDIVFKWR